VECARAEVAAGVEQAGEKFCTAAKIGSTPRAGRSSPSSDEREVAVPKKALKGVFTMPAEMSPSLISPSASSSVRQA
jgi:hypothetical protein